MRPRTPAREVRPPGSWGASRPALGLLEALPGLLPVPAEGDVPPRPCEEVRLWIPPPRDPLPRVLGKLRHRAGLRSDLPGGQRPPAHPKEQLRGAPEPGARPRHG